MAEEVCELTWGNKNLEEEKRVSVDKKLQKGVTGKPLAAPILRAAPGWPRITPNSRAHHKPR